LLAVLCVLHRRALQVEVLRIDRLLIEDLIEFGTQVFHPVVPLGAGTVIAQCFNVDHASYIGRPSTVVLLPNDAALVIDDVGATTKGINGRGFVGKEIITNGASFLHTI